MVGKPGPHGRRETTSLLQRPHDRCLQHRQPRGRCPLAAAPARSTRHCVFCRFASTSACEPAGRPPWRWLPPITRPRRRRELPRRPSFLFFASPCRSGSSWFAVAPRPAPPLCAVLAAGFGPRILRLRQLARKPTTAALLARVPIVVAVSRSVEVVGAHLGTIPGVSVRPALPPRDRLGGLLPAAPSDRRRGPLDRLDGTLHSRQTDSGVTALRAAMPLPEVVGTVEPCARAAYGVPDGTAACILSTTVNRYA